MVEKIESFVINKSDKCVAHIYSIILRAWHEEKYMRSKNIKKDFCLRQMEGFQISFKDRYFKLNIDNNIIVLNINDMNNLSEYIYEYFKIKYPINYDYKLIDTVYFSLFFYDLLDKIIDVKYDKINIKDIKLLRKGLKPVSINESERYKALIDSSYEMYSPFKSNLFIDTPRDRLNNVLNIVKENGYGKNDQYAILYNDEPYLRDGQHRVSALKYIYGDIDIYVIRFYLKDNYFYE